MTGGVRALRRAFVAVVPPRRGLRWTESAADAVRPDDAGLRWTPVGQRHLTLQFLGRVADVESLAVSLGESVRRFAPFTLALGGGGAFPSPRRASVLWLGVQQGRADLGALAATVSGATASLVDDAEDRPYRAHVTMARASRARDLRTLVDRLDATPRSPSWTVDHVVLFESDTRSDGAVHTECARVRLAG